MFDYSWNFVYFRVLSRIYPIVKSIILQQPNFNIKSSKNGKMKKETFVLSSQLKETLIEG